MRIHARTSETPAPCPGCGMASGRVHSRYDRHLSDTATAGQEVLIRLQVRRLFCDNPHCVKKTFAEQVPALTSRHARRNRDLTTGAGRGRVSPWWPCRCPTDTAPGRIGQPDEAATDPAWPSRPATPHSEGARRGRLRPARRSPLRHAAGRPRVP
ncbi:transposase family protein [Kutzneria buriramensis]|uniref:transposase family protein n=1 Tax=Kutzneria buriramensis TaxID=1045776 RepID=UPI0035E5FFEF